MQTAQVAQAMGDMVNAAKARHALWDAHPEVVSPDQLLYLQGKVDQAESADRLIAALLGYSPIE